jgi:DNA anti-recombination protein RmuC
MKTFQILPAMLLLGLTTVTFAQNDVDAVRRQVLYNVEKRFQRFDLVNGINARLLVAQGITSSEAFYEELGLSQDEAIEFSQRVMTNTHPILMNEDLVYKSLYEERAKLKPFLPDATEETVEKYTDLWMQMNEIEQKKRIELIHETYSPDQMKKINEFLIADMSETEYVFPGMFEVLELSDEQKKQLDEIIKELEPEFEKHIDEMVEYHFKQKETTDAKLKAITDPEERVRLRNDFDFIQKIFADIKPERDKMMMSGKKLTNNLKIKMFDVLTDE